MLYTARADFDGAGFADLAVGVVDENVGRSRRRAHHRLDRKRFGRGLGLLGSGPALGDTVVVSIIGFSINPFE
jgi:hypothetical protein